MGVHRVELLHVPGEAVQVDPMTPMLTPPGIKHLKRKCDILLSSFASKFKLRRYILVLHMTQLRSSMRAAHNIYGNTVEDFFGALVMFPNIASQLEYQAGNRLISVHRFPRRALALCPQLCMSIHPGARFSTRSADASSAICMGISPRRYTEIGLFMEKRERERESHSRV